MLVPKPHIHQHQAKVRRTWAGGLPKPHLPRGWKGREKKKKSRKGLRQKYPSEWLCLAQPSPIRKSPRESSNINKWITCPRSKALSSVLQKGLFHLHFLYMNHDLLIATEVSGLFLWTFGLRDVTSLFFFCHVRILAMVLTAGGTMQWQKAKPGKFQWGKGDKQNV